MGWDGVDRGTGWDAGLGCMNIGADYIWDDWSMGVLPFWRRVSSGVDGIWGILDGGSLGWVSACRLYTWAYTGGPFGGVTLLG